MNPNVTNDVVNPQQHMSSVNYLKKIYTLEEESKHVSDSKMVSVFFEFIESKYGDKASTYMNRVCYEASKMSLNPDKRVPNEAKQGFCYGFISTSGESTLQLVKKVERAMTWGNKPEYEVQIIPIEASMLEHNLHKMPAKDYGEVFGTDYSDQWS